MVPYGSRFRCVLTFIQFVSRLPFAGYRWLRLTRLDALDVAFLRARCCAAPGAFSRMRTRLTGRACISLRLALLFLTFC